MTVLLVPKPEPVSSGPWPDGSKSEANVRGGSKDKLTLGLVTEARSPPSRTISNRADDSSAPDKMIVLTAPKPEPTSSGHWSDVSKSEANLRRGTNEESTMSVVTEPRSPSSRTTLDRASDASAPEKVVDERHESNCLQIVALPVVDVAPPKAAKMKQNAKEPRRTATLDHIYRLSSEAKSVVKDKRRESSLLSIVALPAVAVAPPKEPQERENAKEPKTTSERASELDHVFGAFSDGKSAIKKVGLKWQALGHIIQQKKKLEFECEEGKKLLAVTRRILSKRRAKVQELESERQATLAALNEKEAVLKEARDEMQTMNQKHDAAVADIWEQLRELEANRDAAVSELWGQRREFEAKCSEMQREADDRCEAWQREAGNRIVADSKEKLLLRRELCAAVEQRTQCECDFRNVLFEKQQLEHKLIGVVSSLNYKIQREEMDRGKAEERLKREMEQLEENRVLNLKLADAQTRKRKLEVDLASEREENVLLRTTQETTISKLHEDHRKTLCQICSVSPKDTVPFPCLHLHFCFACLEKHYKLNKTCPSCKISINCYMRCNIVS